MATSESSNSPHSPALEPHHILQYGPLTGERKVSGSSTSTTSAVALGKKREYSSRPQAYSSSSRNTQTSSSARAENRLAQRDVRTLPSWIDSYEEDDSVPKSKATDRLLPPPSAHSAQHNFAPSTPKRRVSQDGFVDTFDDVEEGGIKEKQETGFFGQHREPVKGRKWDHAREGEPVIMTSGLLQDASPWRTYIKSSMYGPALDEDGKRVDEEFLRQQTPGYQAPWRGDLEGGLENEKLSGLLYNKKQQRTMIKRLQHNLLVHPLVPLMFRVTVLITSIVALGLASSIHQLTSTSAGYKQSPSTIMAIVVDVVAIPYILYITWDEYTGKPLGLRAPKTKIRLVLLDVFFIIFESANLSLAFQNLTESEGTCRPGSNGTNPNICGRLQALCGILMIALIAWSLTFSVSIFRLVERVGGREETD